MKSILHFLIIAFCLRALHCLALKFDFVRYVESQTDETTARDDITSLHDKGVKPEMRKDVSEAEFADQVLGAKR